ncbi:hypothetical protein BVG80_13120 [Sphingobacteriales bacterium TSM_CSM]|nr:hypothetical protein BVG80_13120 [Sphingobacteriales bacterium TSM_CSM]
MKTFYFKTMLNIGFIWALLAALPCVQTLMAQYSNRNIIITPPQKLSEGVEDNEVVYEYSYITNPSGIKTVSSLAYKVHFVSKSSRDTCASFDLKDPKNNPYQNLPYKESKKPLYYYLTDFKTYDLSNEKPQTIIQNFFPEAEKVIQEKGCFSLMATQVEPLQQPSSLNMDKQFVAIAYTLIAELDHNKCRYSSMGMADYRGVLFQTTILVLNNKGEVIAKVISNRTNCQRVEIDNTGRYIAFSYGSTMEDFENVEDGYKIYDLGEQALLVNKKVTHVNGCVFEMDYCRCSYENNQFVPTATTYSFYMLPERVVYTKPFERGQKPTLKEFWDRLIQFYPKTSGNLPKDWKKPDSIYYLFEESFTKEKL